MNIDPCCAAKDFLRAYYRELEDMIYGMSRIKDCNSIACCFASKMLQHNRSAIAISENLLTGSFFEPPRFIAKHVIEDGRQNLANMRKILNSSSKYRDNKDDLNSYNRSATLICERMFDEMRTAEMRERINCDYLRIMMPHSEGAVRLAENAIGYGIAQGLVPIAKSIIAEKKQLIAEIQRLLCMIDC